MKGFATDVNSCRKLWVGRGLKLCPGENLGLLSSKLQDVVFDGKSDEGV